MGWFETTATAAVAALDASLLSAQQFRTSNRNRLLRGIAFTGSAASGDCAIDIFVGQKWVGRKFNSKTGAPDRDDVVAMIESVPAGAEIIAKVIDAAATNPVFVALDVVDV